MGFASKFDTFIVLFFLLHIPTTVLLDSQGLFPQSWYPAWALRLLSNHVQMLGDPLMKEMPNWFTSLVFLEVFVQLPFFFVGAYAFATKREWIRFPALLYGINVASTMVPILASLALDPRTDFNRPALLAIYAPYLLVPFGIAVRVMTAGPRLFSSSAELHHEHAL